MKSVAQFDIPYYQILNEEACLVDALPDFAKNPIDLIRLYRLMVLNRLFDAKAIALQRTGKMGTYPSTLGQEAVFVGIGAAMAPTDILVPYYRDAAALFMRGTKLSEILLYWGGDERGNCFAENPTDYPYCVPIGTQLLHAVGAATAIKIRQQKRAVLVVCGDGATSQGDFYEAMNVAGSWQLPVVFVVNNNQWAISLSRAQQTAAETIAQKAIAAGFSGEQVDGNDVICVQHRVEIALKKARETYQPTLIEMLCYRQSDHTTADDASRYEPKESRAAEWKKEPLARLKRYLSELKIEMVSTQKKLDAECTEIIDQAVQTYLDTAPAPLESLFDYLYAELPQSYLEQRDSLKNKEASHD